jgi:hypothetical protein
MSCSKSKRLCDKFEMRFVELFLHDNATKQTTVSFKELVLSTERMTDNGRNVQAKLRSLNYIVPLTFAEFVESLKAIHRELFTGLGLADAGEFRESEVWVDKNANIFEGSKFSEINRHLELAWDRYFVRFCQKVAGGEGGL